MPGIFQSVANVARLAVPSEFITVRSTAVRVLPNEVGGAYQLALTVEEGFVQRLARQQLGTCHGMRISSDWKVTGPLKPPEVALAGYLLGARYLAPDPYEAAYYDTIEESDPMRMYCGFIHSDLRLLGWHDGCFQGLAQVIGATGDLATAGSGGNFCQPIEGEARRPAVQRQLDQVKQWVSAHSLCVEREEIPDSVIAAELMCNLPGYVRRALISPRFAATLDLANTLPRVLFSGDSETMALSPEEQTKWMTVLMAQTPLAAEARIVREEVTQRRRIWVNETTLFQRVSGLWQYGLLSETDPNAIATLGMHAYLAYSTGLDVSASDDVLLRSYQEQLREHTKPEQTIVERIAGHEI